MANRRAHWLHNPDHLWVANASKQGRKSEVAHKWADGRNTPCCLGGRQCFREAEKIGSLQHPTPPVRRRVVRWSWMASTRQHNKSPVSGTIGAFQLETPPPSPLWMQRIDRQKHGFRRRMKRWQGRGPGLRSDWPLALCRVQPGTADAACAHVPPPPPPEGSALQWTHSPAPEPPPRTSGAQGEGTAPVHKRSSVACHRRLPLKWGTRECTAPGMC